MFFDDEGGKPNPFAVFDGHAVYLVAVPHGRRILTNGKVLGEIVPNVHDAYIGMLFDRAMQNRKQSTKPENQGEQGNEPQS
jgi:hypothetical protein